MVAVPSARPRSHSPRFHSHSDRRSARAGCTLRSDQRRRCNLQIDLGPGAGWGGGSRIWSQSPGLGGEELGRCTPHYLGLRFSSSARRSSEGTGRLALLGHPERLVDRARHPQAVEQHREFPCDCDHGPLLRVLPTARRERVAPASEVRIRTKGPKDVMGAAQR